MLVAFHTHLPEGPELVIFQLLKKGKLRLAQGNQNMRAACPKGYLVCTACLPQLNALNSFPFFDLGREK